MATIVEIDAQISVITLALGRGESKVRFPDGSEVTYRSTSDMRLALDTLRRERDILSTGGLTGRVRPQFFLVRPVRDW
jgi:hypothetical protein